MHTFLGLALLALGGTAVVLLGSDLAFFAPLHALHDCFSVASSLLLRRAVCIVKLIIAELYRCIRLSIEV